MFITVNSTTLCRISVICFKMSFYFDVPLASCLSVRSHILKAHKRISTNFLYVLCRPAFYLWPWLSPPLTAVQNVVYTSGFYGWRHVLSLWNEWARIRRRMASAVAQAYGGCLELCPHWVHGQSPWSGSQVANSPPPLKLKQKAI